MLARSINTIDASWIPFMQAEMSKPYFDKLTQFLKLEYAQHKVFPTVENIFAALTLPLASVKVLLLGQDPYHDENQAHGLSFSVPVGVKIPPSLRNIFKELNNDISNYTVPLHGNLTQWAEQGVLLLNSTLTVRAHEAGSHQQQGWETFTNNLLSYIANQRSHLVVMLWGAYAQSKQQYIMQNNTHLILCAPHPSPLSAHRGWFGSGHFSKANIFLKQKGFSPIVW